MREVIGVSSRRLDGPRRCTTQPPQLVGGNASESFKPGYLELAPEILERILSTDNIEDHYDVEELPFARGKYATVRRCRHRKTNQQYAAKYLKKRRRSTDLRYEILHEVAVLHACAQSPRIVNLYQIFETAHEMILVLELAAGGELQMLLDNDQIPAEKTVKRLMRQILDGLEFLHSINVAHLDIKPQNLVLTSELPGCDVKLCDFGISRYIGENADIREILGTPDYVAPEVLNYEAISLSTDMWSVGVLMYVLLTGCSPFGGDTKQETFCNISQCRLDFPDDLFEDISEDAQDLMKRLMVKKSSLRLTASECLQHPWFQTTDLPKSVPSAATSQSDAASTPANISDVLVRTSEAPRKMTDTSVKRQSSIKRCQEITRKTIECVRGSGEAPPKMQLFTKTPEVSRRCIPATESTVHQHRLSEICANKENNPKLADKARKHSFNESFHDSSSVREKTRKLSGEKAFENRRQTSMRDLTRRSSVELLVSSIISKKKQNSFRESRPRGSDGDGEDGDKLGLVTPKTTGSSLEGSAKDGGSESVDVEGESKGTRRQNLRENLSNLAKKFVEESESLRKYQTLHRNSKLFAKTEEEGTKGTGNEGESAVVKKALSSQTLPVHPIFHRQSDKVFKCKRIYIDDELGNNTATILIPVNSGQSSMSSISGGSSETSSITSDTVSEMSVDSGGDCSSFVLSDDSLDCGTVYKGTWDSGAAATKTGKVWAKECKGSFERALSRFNLEQSPEPRSQGQRRYQKNAYGTLTKRSMCTSSPILNKIGNLVSVGSGDCKKYGVQLMKEGSGNLVIIREVKAGRYTKFSEVKCESVQSRIRKLQDQTGKS